MCPTVSDSAGPAHLHPSPRSPSTTRSVVPRPLCHAGSTRPLRRNSAQAMGRAAAGCALPCAVLVDTSTMVGARAPLSVRSCGLPGRSAFGGELVFDGLQVRVHFRVLLAQ